MPRTLIARAFCLLCIFLAVPLFATDEPKPTEISAADLCAAVAKDANAAGSKYGGGQLIVTGTVADIETGNYNNVTLAGPKDGAAENNGYPHHARRVRPRSPGRPRRRHHRQTRNRRHSAHHTAPFN